MPPDTSGSATIKPVANTPFWKMRLDPALKRRGMDAATEAGEDLSSLVRLGIQAVVVDARAFIVACQNIIREEKK